MNNEKMDFKFDKRASVYDDGFEGKLSKKFYNLLLKQIELKQNDYVLDVGCGTGSLLKRMGNTCNINGYGIDVEENMINEAKKKCPEMNIQISKCEETQFDNQTFNILTACMAYHHFNDKEGFAKEASRILKVGGYLYIADPKFPKIIRKTINIILKTFNIVGEFYTPEEITKNFQEYGFELIDYTSGGYAQVVKLKKIK